MVRLNIKKTIKKCFKIATFITAMWAGLASWNYFIDRISEYPKITYKRTKIILNGNELYDYRGTIHVHTNYSADSGGDFLDVVVEAKRNANDFVIITDHNDVRSHKYAGEHFGVLFIKGEEVSTKYGHLVVVNNSKGYYDIANIQPNNVIRIANKDGVAIAAHPYWEDNTWKKWTEDLTHIEIFNLASDNILDNYIELPARYFLFNLFNYRRSIIECIERPDKVLRKWDELNLSGRKVYGIGSADAHELYINRELEKRVDIKIHAKNLPLIGYEEMFGIVSTHCYSENLSLESIVKAIRKGNCYVAFDCFGDTKGFYFKAKNSIEEVNQGDTISFDEKTELLIYTPEYAETHLYINGKKEKRLLGKEHVIKVDKKGFYRIEIYKNGWNWVFSNPIWIE